MSDTQHNQQPTDAADGVVDPTVEANVQAPTKAQRKQRREAAAASTNRASAEQLVQPDGRPKPKAGDPDPNGYRDSDDGFVHNFVAGGAIPGGDTSRDFVNGVTHQSDEAAEAERVALEGAEGPIEGERG